MSIEIINQIKTLLILLGGVCAVSIALGICFAYRLKKNSRVIVNGTFIDATERNKRISYLEVFGDYPAQLYSKNKVYSARLYSRNKTLQDFEPGLKNLEHIPSGKVSKMFINGRGSWRLTQGNILTKDYLESAIQNENKQKL